MFRITNRKGFHITFDNGITVSVQFGEGNYCSNKLEVHKDQGDIISSNAEISVWDKDNIDIINEYMVQNNKLNGGDELGWVSPDEVADIISWAKNHK